MDVFLFVLFGWLVREHGWLARTEVLPRWGFGCFWSCGAPAFGSGPGPPGTQEALRWSYYICAGVQNPIPGPLQPTFLHGVLVRHDPIGSTLAMTGLTRETSMLTLTQSQLTFLGSNPSDWRRTLGCVAGVRQSATIGFTQPPEQATTVSTVLMRSGPLDAGGWAGCICKCQRIYSVWKARKQNLPLQVRGE